MIRTKRGLLVVATLTLVTGLIVLFPARIAYQWTSPSELKLSGIRGTVWRGSADAGGASGIYLSDITWRFRPLQLLTGKAAYSVTGSPLTGFVEGNIGISIGGTVFVSDLAASLPLPMLSDLLNVRGLQGDASVQFERIQLHDGLPVAANGSVQVNNLVAPRLSRESIGGFRAEFFTQNNGVAASIEETDGVIDLAASLQVKDDRSYQFLGKVVAKPETPANLRQKIETLGPEGELRIEGML